MVLDDSHFGGSWSPSGDDILFVARESEGHHKAIWVVNADGGAPEQLPITPVCGGPLDTPDEYGCYSPDWSPDGDRIVFTRSEPDRSNETLWIVNADGTTPCRSPTAPTTTRLGDHRRHRERRATGKPRHSEPGRRSAPDCPDGGCEATTRRCSVASWVWSDVSLECPAAVRLASERTGRRARSSRGVARKRNGIDTYQGCPAVANSTTRRGSTSCSSSGSIRIRGRTRRSSSTVAKPLSPRSVSRLIGINEAGCWSGRPGSSRTWAVEGATGMGALLAQQLVGAGEHVVDVPAKLSARVRLLERGRSTRPTPTMPDRRRSWRGAPRAQRRRATDQHRSCCACWPTAIIRSPPSGRARSADCTRCCACSSRAAALAGP